MTYWISLPHATFLVEAKNGRVVDTAPIARWTLGRDIVWVLDYYRNRGARIDWINREQ